jgi:SAM-dependent methyltransferase
VAGDVSGDAEADGARAPTPNTVRQAVQPNLRQLSDFEGPPGEIRSYVRFDGMRRALEYSMERGLVDRFLRRLPPGEATRLRHRLRRLSRPARLGTLRNTTPLSHDFGYDRGTPVDRYYIERFLQAERSYIRGRVLEVKDSTYTISFGVGVTQRDVLDVDPANALATFVADLAAGDGLPDATFDCFILTQTLQLIYDVRSAVSHAHRILRPGGALLATIPVVSPVVDDEQLTDYWRFTVASCTELFGDFFGRDSIHIRSYGNVLTAIAFLTGMAYEELTAHELNTHDARHSMLISIRAVKK